MGDAADKFAKNRRKTMGLLRDLAGIRTAGIVAEDRERGLIEIARPVGVVAAITPSTNPGATPANNIVNALKARNAIAYLPGALLTGVPVPTLAEVAAIRAPAGENAARWLHLMAATVAVVVVAPRLLLALGAWMVERHRATRFALPLDDPYFRRLLRGYRGGPARVRVVPYSYAATPAAIAGLEAIVARSFGGSAALLVASPVAYGADDALAGSVFAALMLINIKSWN